MRLVVTCLAAAVIVRQCLSKDKYAVCKPRFKEVPALIYPADYHRNEAPLPRNPGEEPMKVKINMEVWAISDISLLRQDMQVDTIITVEWYDKRLLVNPNRTINRPWIRLGEETFQIWRPTLLFRNCKGCVPLSLGSAVPMFVDKRTGMFWAQQRILTTYSCGINLQAYPMDKQNCSVLLYTNERTSEVLVLEHSKPEIKYIKPIGGLARSEFYIPHIIKGKCVVLEDGADYSCIQLNIPLERLLGYHLMTSYSPTTFIVILSWISFWLPVDVVPARIALGLTSLLTLATRLDQAQRNLPPVSYVKAIDVWMFACIFMVSASLLEFSVAYYRFRVAILKCNTKKANVVHVIPSVGKHKPKPCSSRLLATINTNPQADGTTVDRVSRIMFPLLFIIFNISYWSYYLTYYKK